jgi:hypothetical protein
MRKIRDAMRLRASGFSTRQIAASLGVSHRPVRHRLIPERPARRRAAFPSRA